MAKIFDNGRVLGLLGIFAAVVYIIVLFVAAFTTAGFHIGVEDISKLHDSTIYMAGCVIAGLLGMVFGAGLIMRAKGGAVITKAYGAIFTVTALVLIVLAVMGFDDTVFWVFFALACVTMLASIADDWVSDQKVAMILTAFFLIVVLATGLTDAIKGFALPFFIAVWVLLLAFIQYAEVVVPVDAVKSKKAEPAKKTEKKKAEPAKKTETKKSDAKKPEAKKAAPAKQAEPAKKAEPKKEEPKKPEPKPEPAKAEPAKKPEPKPAADNKAEEIPKLKVMSSRNAAAVRETAKEQVVIKEEPKPEPVQAEPEPVKQAEPEPAVEPVAQPEPEPVVEDEAFEADFEGEEGVDIAEDTPDALVRRAAWNKGLRCRRDYGEHNIPVAFVKGKVAVYVLPEKGDTSADEVLKAEGWTVLRYLESDITDGKAQGEEIAAIVKENVKLENAAKKKKKPAKK